MNKYKDRLVEILKNDPCPSPYLCDSNCKYAHLKSCYEERIADNLIENGVIAIPETGIGDLSDGYHTFNELYHHRAILFSVICNVFKNRAWKSKKHHDGTMYDGMFIVGIDTPKGQATYHYDIDPYWDIFQVKELSNAPEWDGHTPDEAINRISTLTDIEVFTLPCNIREMNNSEIRIIKEFAERLKNKIKTECNPYGKPTFDYDTSIAIMRYVDILIKEMAGGEQ